MDQATQQNAALVEESAAAAESLKAQALQLVQAMAVFKLNDGAVHAHAPVAARPAPAPRPAVDRRGPDRAKNVVRPQFKAPAKAAAPAPLPASTPTALQWVTPPEPAPAPIPEPVAAPAAAVPEPAPAQPAPAQPAPVQPASTPTANDNPINPATNEPYAPFDPFAPDPFSLEGLTPNVPGAQQGSKSYVPPADPQP